MRRIALCMIATAIGLVVLFSYRTSLSGPTTVTVVAHGAQAPGIVPAAPATPVRPSHRPPAATGTPRRSSAAPSPAAEVTVNGTVVDTRWGPVQVQVAITDNRIADVTTLVYPTGTGRDEEINSYALPILRQQALAAQSASISGVSGATYTSEGYRQSLQAALDAAHFNG